MRRARSYLLVAAVVSCAPSAWAQAEDQAAARTLFDEAKQLMRGGKYEAACPKLEAAAKLYSGSGVLLNLGDCYEHVGRTASAWTMFGEAVAAAARLGRSEDEAEGRRRQAAVEPKLSKVAIRVAAPVPGLVVKRDGKELDRAVWGTAIPLDPGPHAATASAPERQPWSTSFTVSEPGKTITIDVPELAQGAAASSGQGAALANPPAAERRASDAEPASYWTTRRVLGVGLAGAGVIAMGVGGGLGLSAKSQYDDAEGETGAARHDKSLSAVSTGDVATVVVGVGAAVAVVGLVLWITAPSARAATARNHHVPAWWGTF